MAETMWQGRQWRVIDGFIEAETESGVYDISWQRLGPAMSDLRPAIHIEIAGKRWVDFEDFCAAYRKAVELAGIDSHDIDAMEAAGRARRERSERK